MHPHLCAMACPHMVFSWSQPFCIYYYMCASNGLLPVLNSTRSSGMIVKSVVCACFLNAHPIVPAPDHLAPSDISVVPGPRTLSVCSRKRGAQVDLEKLLFVCPPPCRGQNVTRRIQPANTYDP